MAEIRTAVKILSDPTRVICSGNGKPYTFTPMLKPGDQTDVPPRTAKDLVAAGAAKRV